MKCRLPEKRLILPATLWLKDTDNAGFKAGDSDGLPCINNVTVPREEFEIFYAVVPGNPQTTGDAGQRRASGILHPQKFARIDFDKRLVEIDVHLNSPQGIPSAMG
jgi:hypothetical protein